MDFHLSIESGGFLLQLASAFFAGILASLSPCVYPLLPVTLGFFGLEGRQGRVLQVCVFTLGQVLIFFLLGLLAVWAKLAIGLSSEEPFVQIALGLLFFFFAFYSLFPFWASQINRLAAGVLGVFWKKKEEGDHWSEWGKRFGNLPRAFLFGMGTSLLVSPCTTPILSGILAMASTKESMIQGAILLVFYSIGFGSLLFFLGIGFLKLKRIPKSGAWLEKIHLFSAYFLIALGLYYLYSGVSTLYFEGS